MNRTIKEYLEVIKFFNKEELQEEIENIKGSIERVNLIGCSYGFTKERELTWYNDRLTNCNKVMQGFN